MKNLTLSMTVLALGLLVSCKEKSLEVKKVEAATADAVASGKMTEDEAKTINKVAEKADAMKDEAAKMITDQLAALEKATTPDEMKAAVRSATKANVDLAVKSGMMAKEQSEAALKSLDGIDMMPEPAIKQMIEHLKATLKQAQAQSQTK